MTSPDYGRADEINPNDPDPGAPGPGVSADSPGVPVGSAESVGESTFVDGAERSGDSDDGALETPIISMPGGTDADLED